MQEFSFILLPFSSLQYFFIEELWSIQTGSFCIMYVFSNLKQANIPCINNYKFNCNDFLLHVKMSRHVIYSVHKMARNQNVGYSNM
jgi:hypothetical protein